MATGSFPRRSAWNPAWTLAAASLALMMAFLDALVVTTALPALRLSLHSSLASLGRAHASVACVLLFRVVRGVRD